MSEYSGQEGASGDAFYGWSVQATDCANNATKRMVWSKPEILEENNYSIYEGTHGTITYAGSWSTVTCACASRGAMKKTSARGASFTYTDYWNRDDHLGLVMARGPGRGSADVYVDGRKVATVNTYATTTQNRVIVYDKWMSAGTHTRRAREPGDSGASPHRHRRRAEPLMSPRRGRAEGARAPTEDQRGDEGPGSQRGAEGEAAVRST
jgi:hypothetical protein